MLRGAELVVPTKEAGRGRPLRGAEALASDGPPEDEPLTVGLT